MSEHGPIARGELARILSARYWGPGVFREALREATEEGAVVRLSRNTIAPAGNGVGAGKGGADARNRAGNEASPRRTD